MLRRDLLALAAAPAVLPAARLLAATKEERHFLYVAEPGIRNYLYYGGLGLLVYDIDHGQRLIKRIPTWSVAAKGARKRQGHRGERANRPALRQHDQAAHVHRPAHRQDALGEELEGGCDRMAITPDGRTLYVPVIRRASWNVVAARTAPPWPRS